MGRATTGVIIVRAAAIAGLTILGAAVLHVLARIFEPLTLLGLALPVAVLASLLFFVVALVLMLRWRTHAQAMSNHVTYRYRVIRLCVAWAVITVLAAGAVLAITYVFAVALNASTDASLLLVTAAIVGPLPLLGARATATVEAIYERWAMPAAMH